LPISYQIDAARRTVSIHACDYVTMAELEAHRNALCSDPAYKVEFSQIWDVSSLHAIDLTPHTMREEAAFPWCALTPHIAVYATSDYAYGMARMFEGYAELTKRSIRIFRSHQEAQDWLDSVQTSKQSA
jgi:hypothetical protein